MNYDYIIDLSNFFVKSAQEITQDDPFLAKLFEAKLANNITENENLIKVVEEMAAQGVPAGQGYNASLAVGPGNGIIISVNPENKIVEKAIRKNIAPLIQKAMVGLGDLKGFTLNNWINNLYWEE
jgi:hypothetical protein